MLSANTRPLSSDMSFPLLLQNVKKKQQKLGKVKEGGNGHTGMLARWVLVTPGVQAVPVFLCRALHPV
jgi:hypothetical protein